MRGLNNAVYTVSSTALALMPRPTVAAPCGSKSTISTRLPYWLSAPPILMELVVLPTPPFWLHMAMTFAGPCVCSGSGAGNVS